MAIEVKFRRGSATDHATFTGANGEVTFDTTNKTLVAHDGVTAGGFRLAKYSEINTANLQAVTTSIVPAANVTYDLGTPDLAWRELYLSGNTIYLAGNKITTTGNTVSIIGANNQPVRLVTDSVSIGSVDTGDATVLKSRGGVLTTVSAINDANELPTQFANVSITSLVLENVLGTQYGGTGLSSFTTNGVIYAANSSSLAFATGTAGKLLQINEDGAPAFDDLDGGSF